MAKQKIHQYFLNFIHSPYNPMGLDMYLHKKTWIGNHYKEPKDQVPVDVDGVQSKRVSQVEEMVGVWRKANQIHNWFVTNVQGGEDNCAEYYVSYDQLMSLLAIVNEVLASTKLIDGDVKNGEVWDKNGHHENIEKGKILEDSTVAERLLPTSSGFFFGSYDYDEYYWADLEHTKEILEALKKDEHGDFYYQSSW
jgi:hypothetical protein